MYAIDCGNYQTKVAVKERTDTTTLCDRLYRRWHLSSLRQVDEHRVFGSHGRGARFNLVQRFYGMTEETARTISFDMYEFLAHLQREYGIPSDATVTLTTGLALPLRLIFSTLAFPLFRQVQVVPEEVSVASRAFLSYYSEICAGNGTVFQGFCVGEFEISTFVASMTRLRVAVVDVVKLPFGAFNFDQLVSELCSCAYEANLEAIKRCRQVLSLNDVATVTLVERDVAVQKTQYLSAGSAYTAQIAEMLAEMRRKHRPALFEAVGGAARDAICVEAMQQANIVQQRRLNWEEAQASGALIFDSLARKMQFYTLLDADIAVVLARNGQDLATAHYIKQNTQIPTEDRIELAVKPHMHIKLVCRTFLLRVYEFTGMFAKNVLTTVTVSISGDAQLQGDSLKEIFTYNEKSLLDALEAGEQTLYAKDCEWDKQNGA